jgi:hypothetical protein
MGLASLPRAVALLAGVCCTMGWMVPSHDVRTRINFRMPSLMSMSTLTATVISRNVPAPVGPDPYKLVIDDLDQIKAGLKKVLTSKGKGTSSALSSNEVHRPPHTLPVRPNSRCQCLPLHQTSPSEGCSLAATPTPACLQGALRFSPQPPPFLFQVLSMAAREFMERKGKSFRPMLVLSAVSNCPLADGLK